MEDAPVRNPREKASSLSLLTFSWISHVLKLGSKQPLEEKHLFAVETSHQTERLVADLEREWLAEERSSEQSRTKPRLWKAMMRIIPCRDYIAMAFIRFCYTIALNVFPVIIWFFLRSISTSSEMSYKATLPFVIGISLVAIARSLCLSHGMFKAEMITSRLKAAMIGLVYKKILNLNRGTLQDTISENTINLVSNDAQAIEQLSLPGFVFPFAPLDLVISMALLWYLLAWQALTGASFFLLVVAYGSFAAHKTGKVRHQSAAVTDKRLEMMKEIITGIRVVKMYAWEWNFRDLVSQIRRKEISLFRIRGFMISSIYALFFTSSAMAGFVSITVMLFTKHPLTSLKIFTLISILSNIQFIVTVFIAEALHFIADARTACNRMQRLIEKKAILTRKMDHKDKPSPLDVHFKGRRNKPQFIRIESFRKGRPALVSARKLEQTSEHIQPQVFIENISCFWSQISDRPALRNVSLSATNGQLVGITGPVGSGKTSLLMTILGELPISSGKISCIGKVAYISQTPWVYSGTVRENIVFGNQFDEQKYTKVIEVCDLQKDIAHFTKHDLTEIGQRGVILSGGQRARVSLARAIYSDADIYLLDDPLSAVDAKVGKHLFERCIKEYLEGRLRILVTHQLQFLKQTDSIVMLRNGSVVCQGTYSGIEKNKQVASCFLSQAKQDLNGENKNNEISSYFTENTFKSMNAAKEDRDRVDLKEEEEDRMVGTVKWWLYWKYLKAALPTVLIIGLIVFFAIVQVFWIAPYWWLSRMSEMPFEQQKSYTTLVVYGSIVTVSLLLTIISSFCFYLVALKASENLHDQMTKAVMKAPVLFFDTNPVGRILNRFSKDIGSMDALLPGQFLFATQSCLYFLSATILSAVTNVWLFITCTPLTVFFIYLAKYYLKSAREIRRLEALTCSPVYSLIADTVAGLEVIRSSEMEDDFLRKFYQYQDKNTAALVLLKASTRWLALRGDVLSNFLVTSVSAGALFATQSPALAGMSLTFAAETLEISQYGIRVASETENYMTSVERVFTYTEIDPEPGYSTKTLPSEEWPTTGTLTLRDLSLAYLKGAPATLNNISVYVADKEKVGVAGRTGAGKSSLVSALFRMPEPEGEVIIDGVNIKDLNLQASRRSMAVITQDPVLFSGTLRKNLDPFSLYQELDLWRALEDVQLKTLIQQLPDQLEYKLRESGNNFSVGERQLLCLARALLQRSKIIILDEATANVDFKTDRLIQEVIRNRFKDSTVVTIAHRLNTIMDYDKVLVMEQGRVVEFDKPEVLLQNKNGVFSRLVQTFNIAAAEKGSPQTSL
ncbi:ATP-binding cassette sub-family C member 4-like isoform X1 [Oculina patagonica]